jgi:hypothetical protein
MKRRILLVFAALILALSCRAALAWNSIGHMSVAWVAYQKLTPVEKARVKALLRRNPYYKKWLSNIPAGTSSADRDLYVFMMAATWPDQIKAMGSGYTGNDNPPHNEMASLNDGYAAKKAHKYWHFVDTPLGGDPANQDSLSSPNVTQKITAFRAELAGKTSAPLKSYALAWLLHLVGDIHQPLHCSTRISTGHPKGDLGGNLVLVAGPAKELHGFWDGALGDGNTKDFMRAVRAVAALPDPDPVLAANDKEGDWSAESFKLAQSAVYVDPVGAGLGPYTLDDVYTANTQKIARERVSLAGARLTVVIKEALQCNNKRCAH